MPSALLTRLLPAALLALLSTGSDCGEDKDPPAVDATPGVCNLPSTVIECTVGDDSPCTAVCDGGYCYNFSQFGVVCTKACTVVADCPSGWNCNMMGRCRPPGLREDDPDF